MTIYSDEFLLNQIRNFFKLHNRAPKGSEITPRREVYRGRFGSLNKAIIAAGIEPLRERLTARKCKHCKVEFQPRVSTQQFCSQSCSATYNNVRKPTRLKREKIKLTSDNFCKLFRCTCQHCGVITSTRKKRTYCDNCVSLYSTPARDRFRFFFNVYQYPDLFDLSLIAQVGWYTGSHTDGDIQKFTRDHRVSVHDAIKYNYDPYYIAHPLNCNIITFAANRQKNKSSSITYNELVKAVDAYDNSAC